MGQNCHVLLHLLSPEEAQPQQNQCLLTRKKQIIDIG